MPKLAILFGLALVALGVVGYLGSATAAADGAEPTRAITALIPAFIGAVLAVCGLIALKETARKHAMHGAATVALLGFLAGVGRGAMGLGKFMDGDPSLNQRSFLFVWIMAALCGLFVFLCIQSFRAARRARVEPASAG
ncbi:MAG: hypothetical protein AAF628_00075 [Planctomycetota bacterium]